MSRRLAAALSSALLLCDCSRTETQAEPDGSEARQHFGETVWERFFADDFAGLEQLANDLRQNKKRFPDGLWKLPMFYGGLDPQTHGKNSEQFWRDAFEKCDQWHAKFPSSITEPVARAHMLIRYGWAARGEDYSPKVSRQGWDLFETRVAQARKCLDDAARLPQRCPEWYVEMQAIAQAQGWDRADYEKLFSEAIGKEPTYYDYYFSKAAWLLPRWYGRPAEWENFAEEATKLDRQEGFTVYTRVAWANSGLFGNIFKESAISWSKMSQGFRDIEKAYPRSKWNLNNFARFACKAGDRNRAHELFKRIGEDWNAQVWSRQAVFKNSKKWADPDTDEKSIKPLHILPPQKPMWPISAAFTTNGDSIVVGYHEGSVIFWDTDTGAQTRSFETRGSTINYLALSNDASLIALALSQTEGDSAGDRVVIQRLDSEPPTNFLPAQSCRGHVRQLCFSPDGSKLLIVGGEYRQSEEAYVLDLKTGKAISPSSQSQQHIIMSGAFTPDQSGVTMACLKSVGQWNLETGAVSHNTRPALPQWTQAIAYSPDGKMLAAAYGGESDEDGGGVRVWDANTSQTLPGFESQGNGICTVAFSRDSRYLASAGLDEAVYIYQMQNGKLDRTLLPGTGTIGQIAFSPSGSMLAVVAHGGVTLWRMGN